MDEYPDPDDEYELLHQEELDMMVEMEEDHTSLDAYYKTKQSRSSLNFDSPASSGKKSKGVEVIDNLDSNSSTHNDIKSKKTPQNSSNVTVNGSNLNSNFKRYMSSEFLTEGDLDVQILEPPHKKRRSTNKTKPDSNPSFNQFGITATRIPKWPFLPIRNGFGDRLYIRIRSENYYSNEMDDYLNNKQHGTHLLGTSYHKLKSEAEKILMKSIERSNNLQSSVTNEKNEMEVQLLESSELWVEKYKPKKYLELLSDEGVNRTLLNWIKMWDKVVFNKDFKCKSKPDDSKVDEGNFKFQNKVNNTSIELDSDGRPHYKIALLCGPPGLGKTTLAHIVATIAGYNVIEVNASDDRSPEVFHTKLEAATKMQSVTGQSKPNCLILDEIDGAPISSIDYLLKYINGKVTEKSKKGKKDKAKGVIRRPVICICNEPYVPSLRQLRQQAYVVNFPHTSSSKLAHRLLEICRKQSIKTDLSTLTLLCEKAQSDIRSCISTLHFFKSKNQQTFKVMDVTNSDIGQKDMQKGLFSLWQEVFQVHIKKDSVFKGSSSISAEEDKAMCLFNYNPKNMARLKNLVHMIQSAGDYDKLLQGVHENFLKMRFPRSKEAILAGLEWFCWSDLMDTNIKSNQNFILMPYLPYSFAAWHFLFSSTNFSKITYPNASYENHVKGTKSKQILNDVVRGLNPLVRAHTHSQKLLLDVLPSFGTILAPSLRPVNIKLFNEKERKEFNQLLNTMIAYNLNYIQQRAADGTYFYQFDPNIDELTRFEITDRNKIFTFSYNMKQLISREVDLEKVRRIDATRSEVERLVEKKQEKVQVHTPDRSVPNHLQKLTPKQINIKDEDLAQYKDFFGRVVKVKKVTASEVHSTDPEGLVKSKIWFCFKEGFNNAVKKDVTIADIL